MKQVWNTDNFWQSIETVLLDMDGTLLDLHFDNYFWQQVLPEHYSKQTGKHKSFNELTAMYSEREGTLDWYSVDFWANTLNIDVMALKREHSHLIGFRPAVSEFLEFLLAKDITPVLVTNAHPKALALKLEICPLDKWIPHLYSSHDFFLPKEDKNFWNSFIKEYNFNKSSTVFIDDNDSVLKTAHAFGIKHCLSIEQPDSRKQRELDSEFPMIKHFKELII